VGESRHLMTRKRGLTYAATIDVEVAIFTKSCVLGTKVDIVGLRVRWNQLAGVPRIPLTLERTESRAI